MLGTDDVCERSISHTVWPRIDIVTSRCDFSAYLLSGLYGELPSSSHPDFLWSHFLLSFICHVVSGEKAPSREGNLLLSLLQFPCPPDFRFSQSLPALSLNQRPPCSIDPKRHPWILFLSLQLSAHRFSVPSQITKCKGWDRGFCTSD